MAVSNENEMIAIESHAEQRVERLAVLVAYIEEAFLDLLNNFLTARRINLRANASAGAAGVFIFKDDAVVNRINTATGDGEFVFAFQLDAEVFLDKGKLACGLDAYFFFFIRHCSSGFDLVGKYGSLL